MSKESEHKAFDKFFKERYGKHKLNPPADLWEKVNSRAADADGSGLDLMFRDRYLGHETAPPNSLWRKISLHTAATKTSFFLKHLSLIKWIGIISVSAIIGITAYQMIIHDDNEETIGIPPKIDRHAKESKEESMAFPADNKLQEKNETTDPVKETSPKANAEDNVLDEYVNTENSFNENKITSKVDIIPSERTINKENEKKNEPIAANNQAKETNEVSNGIDEIITDSTHENQEITPLSQDTKNNKETIESYELGEINIQVDKLQPALPKKDNADKVELTSETSDSKNTNIDKAQSVSDSDDNPEIGVMTSDTSESESSESVWSLAAFISPTYSYRALNGLDQSGVNEFYNNNQSGIWHFSGSVRTALHFNEKWSLNFGLGYSQLIQKLEFRGVSPNEFPNISMDGSNKTITVYSSLNTVMSEHLEFFEFTHPGGDPGNQDDYYPINYNEEQKFKFLTIPITARYLLGNKKIKGIFDAGLQATINVSDASLIQISTVAQPEETVSFEDYHDFNTFGLQFTAGIGSQYDIKNRISLLLLPSFNYSLLNLNNTNYSIIKPWDISVSLGVQYRF
ncbi:MAG: outer membrane beta-barrel protein [Cryomorphaceae bacterium]|nr:outer membrane beta-barrel protein [Cryomorphaceae bacterium]MBL6867756.1 outer membrane beta-barrel protein [Cryomorphaceae bacterium]